MSRLPQWRVSRDKLVGVVVALACLAFSAIGLKINEPPTFQYVDGIRGQTLSIEQAELTVSDVDVGTTIVRDGEVQYTSSGMLVTVRATLAVPGNQSVRLNKAQLITQQRTYAQFNRGALSAPPGFRYADDLLFEVDPSQIDDLTLEIWNERIVYGYYPRARVHLGITAENATQWREAAEGRSLELQPSTTVAIP